MFCPPSPPPQKKRPLANKAHWTMSRMFLQSTRWGWLNIWAPHNFSSQNVQTTNRLADLHLVVYKLSHVSIHIYAKNSLKIMECSRVKLEGRWEHKGCSYIPIKNLLFFTNFTIFDFHVKFALKWQASIGVDTLKWAPNAIKTWPFPTLTFFPTF